MSLEAERSRHLKVPGTYNLRDVGGYPTVNGCTTRWGALFRSDSLHNLSPDGLDALVNAGIRAVIDLRRQDETLKAPSPCAAKGRLVYQNIPLDFYYYLADIRTEPENLGRLYIGFLEYGKDFVCEIIEALASHIDEPVLVHCSAGKDRTGIIMSLVLGALGVLPEVIAADYAQSGPLIQPLLEDLRRDARREGRDMVIYERYLTCEAEYMIEVLDHLKDRYGSVQEYLLSSGVQADTLTRLSRKLVD